jgi:hypothetical protein
MIDSRDEHMDPILLMAKLGLPPKKWTNGKKHNPNKDIGENPN